MQVTYIAIALANILLAAASPAAPEAQGAKLAAVSAVSDAARVSPATQETMLLANPGVQAWCGGFTYAGCNNWCYYLGYRCFGCGSTACWCSNSGC